MSGLFFEKKVDFWSKNDQKSLFLLFRILNFFILFFNFRPYTHILFRVIVKLNAVIWTKNSESVLNFTKTLNKICV